MSVFGYSLPPGCSSLPGEEEQPLDLRDVSTLKGYGRGQHGLCGKDADLDEGGQVTVREAWWFDDGVIKVRGRAYAAIVPAESDGFESDEAYDRYMDYAKESVIGCGYSGEWDGDYWVIGLDYDLQCDFAWDDSKTEDENVEAATAKAYDLIMDDAEVKAFQEEMAQCSRAMGKDKWYEESACSSI